jgi:hypothetical protein
MKKTLPKPTKVQLRLEKETVRVLPTEDLQSAVGGGTKNTHGRDCVGTHTC